MMLEVTDQQGARFKFSVSKVQTIKESDLLLRIQVRIHILVLPRQAGTFCHISGK